MAANNKKKSGRIGFILVGALAACGCAGPLSIAILAAAILMVIVKILLTPICAPLDWFGWHPGPCKIWAAMKSIPSPNVKDVKMGLGSWSIAENALNGAYYLCKDKCAADDPLN